MYGRPPARGGEDPDADYTLAITRVPPGDAHAHTAQQRTHAHPAHFDPRHARPSVVDDPAGAAGNSERDQGDSCGARMMGTAPLSANEDAQRQQQQQQLQQQLQLQQQPQRRQLPPGAAYAPQLDHHASAPRTLVDSPVNSSRPLLSHISTPAHSHSAPPVLHQRRSFVGPSHAPTPSSSSLSSSAAPPPPASTRTAAASAMSLSTQLPAFAPAPAFSPEDRGPYPPLGSPTRDRDRDFGGGGDLDGLGAVPGGPGRPGSLAFDAPPTAGVGTAGTGTRVRDDMAGVGARPASLVVPAPIASSSGPAQAQAQVPRPGTSAPARSPQLVAPSPYALSAPAASAALVVPSSSSAPASASPSPRPSPSPAPPPPPPPHLVPQPEICVECMMRDRDMADVDVTGLGVWDRESDAEWEEQLRWEAEGGDGTGAGGGGSADVHAGGPDSSESGFALGAARRSAYDRESSSSAHAHAGAGRRRVGRGQLLTSGNLKVWTTMNPPAAAHRWRTLQTFLATQAHYLELDRQARLREASAAAAAAASAPSSPIELLPGGPPRNRASSLLSPASLAAEKAALEHEERAALRALKSRSRATLADETNYQPGPQQQQQQQHPSSFRHSSASLLPPPSLYNGASGPSPGQGNASSGSSMRSYSAGDQPWLGTALRRLSSPSAAAGAGAGAPPQAQSQLSASPPRSPATSMASSRFAFPKFGARSTTDLRSLPGGTGGATPRSVSPARTSGDGGSASARRPNSMWSRFRQSASAASVLSFAPSGSMMDMHLGLEQDQRLMMHGAGVGGLGAAGYGSLGHHAAAQGGAAAVYAAQYGAAGAGAGMGQPPYDSYGAAMSDPAVARHADRRERERVLAETAAAREAAAQASAAAAADADGATGGKKKKKGFKGFFNKLVGGGSGASAGRRARSHTLGSSASAPATPGIDRGAPFDASLGSGGGGPGPDDDELAPPPPLSALANEPRYHHRSASTSSVDSFGPYTPPLPPAQQFRQSYHMPMPASGGAGAAADRHSIMTLGSFTSARSNGNTKPGSGGGGGGGRAPTVASRNSWVGRPSLDSLRDQTSLRRPGSFVSGGPAGGAVETEVLAGGVDTLDLDPEHHDDEHDLPLHGRGSSPPRGQKSLPLLPSEAMHRGSPSPYDPSGPYSAAAAFDVAPAGPYANYGASRSAYTLGASSRASLAADFGLASSGGSGAGGPSPDADHTVRKSRSRAKVFSLSFGSGSNKKKMAARHADEHEHVPPPLPASRGASLDSSSLLRYAGGYDARPPGPQGQPVEGLVGGGMR